MHPPSAANPSLRVSPARSRLSLPWLRAAILGSLWASSEILLGSFLHNLRIPLGGTMLASLAVVILSGGVRLWQDERMIWRAGLVCALMKSLSPSAVILGPMAGILMEALVFWGIVLLFRRSIPGILLGGMLVTVTPLLQKLVGILLLYGPDAGRLYVVLLEFTARMMGVQDMDPMMLMVYVGAAHTLPGLLAATLGISVARRTRDLPPVPIHPEAGRGSPFLEEPPSVSRFSPFLLMFHFAVLLAGLAFFPGTPGGVIAVVVLMYGVLTVYRYKELRRRLMRPRLWIEFAAVTALAGLVLGQIGGEGWKAGLTTGGMMALRAGFVTAVFGGISVELRNPRILRWFLHHHLRFLPEALEIAFQTLPLLMATLADQKRFHTRPIFSLAAVMNTTAALAQHYSEERQPPSVFLLSGDKGSGKTTALQNLVVLLRQHSITVGGIVAPAVGSPSAREGYDLVDIGSGTQTPLCRIETDPARRTVGPYRMERTGLDEGVRAFHDARRRSCAVIVLDEVGPLELQGGGWASSVSDLLKEYSGILIFTVRPSVITEVSRFWDIVPVGVWTVPGTDVQTMAHDILQVMSTTSVIPAGGS